MSLELHVVSTFWLGSDTLGISFFFTFWQASHHMNLRDQPWKMLILWCWTDICSCKLFAKVSLMLNNPFLVPSLCKLNHISLCFIQSSTKSPANCLFPSGKSMIFWSHPRCFGPLSKFQPNIKISINTARGFRLSLSCDYDVMYETLERREEEIPFKLEKQGSKKFSPKVLTYLYFPGHIILIFKETKKAHKVLERLELELAKVCLFRLR